MSDPIMTIETGCGIESLIGNVLMATHETTDVSGAGS
jgi:hypothetical protein